ncbi:unnamed protein product [Camellia sinensis]
MPLTIITTTLLFFILIPSKLPSSIAQQQPWIQAGYWFSGSEFPISDINSALFTHLICAFANLNSSTYQLSISSSDNQLFSNFTNTVKQKNPSIKTLLSIGGGSANGSDYSSMISQSSYRKSFIDSSIKTARSYGFHGIDFCWVSVSTDSEMANMAILFDEWRVAIESESRNSNVSTQLILTEAVQYSPYVDNGTFPIESINKNLNWVHVMAYDYYMPEWWNQTGAQAALYDPGSETSTDYGINTWVNEGLPPNKLVLGLPFYGYAWTLGNPKDSAIGAPAKGPAITDDGSMSYKDIKGYIQRYGGVSQYNATYVVNYCTIGSSWIGFDDVEVVKIKVAYAKKKNLLGYFVWQVPYDDNWVLSQAAQEDKKVNSNKRSFFVNHLAYNNRRNYCHTRFYNVVSAKESSKIYRLMDEQKESQRTTMAFDGNTNSPNLQVFTFTNIVLATNNFSFENKLGEGGYGPVYKGTLQNGQEIAVKRLSKTSTQGFEEFKNKVMLTAELQHVNLLKVLGFCTEKEEQMLIYEYMPNKSLDYYIYDPIRCTLLDWEKRVQIIEGITQGLLYLQEYSRLTIIHRDLKVSNILLDNEMKAKIADFGMARIFQKDELEANTSRIAFELWKDGKGMEFMDPSLNDLYSSCKLMRCMQIALLCVQENPVDRPSMLELSSMLKNETTSIDIPKWPAFSTRRDQDEEKVCASRQEIWSVDNASITQIVAR